MSSTLKKLWKRGTRRQDDGGKHKHSHHGSPHPHGALPESSLGGGSDQQGTQSPLYPPPGSAARLAEEERLQQEALVGVLQTTVLEQTQKIKDLGETIDRLHVEHRHQGHHVEALQRLLTHVASAGGTEGMGGFPVGMMAEPEVGFGGKADCGSVGMLAPTPMPLSNYVTTMEALQQQASDSTITPPADAEEDEEGLGLYSYISGFLSAASSTVLPSHPSSSSVDAYTSCLPNLPPATGKVSLDDAQSLLMGQILEKLHLAEDKYFFQAEELHAFKQQLQAQEEEMVGLREEKQKHDRLLAGLKRELAAYKSKLRARDYKEANLEVEIDRYKLEKRSITRMLSEAVVDGTMSATHSAANTPHPQDLGEHFPLSDTYLSPSPVPTGHLSHRITTPLAHTTMASTLHALDQLIEASAGAGGGGAPAAPSPASSYSSLAINTNHTSRHATPPTPTDRATKPLYHSGTPLRGSSLNSTTHSTTSTPMAAEQHLNQLRVEIVALQAELEAARAVSEVEVRKRVAAEHEVALLKKTMHDAGVRMPPPRVARGASGEGGGVEGGEEEEDDTRSDTSDGEVTALVIKEQLSTLRDLKPAFHATWGPTSTEWQVRGKTYMQDKVKIGGTAAQPLFELVHMELLDVETLTHPETGAKLQRADHVTAMFRDLDGVYTRCQLLASRPPPFLLIINFQVPGNPACSMMAYFALSGASRRRLEAAREKVRARKAAEEGYAEAKTVIAEETGVVEEEEEYAAADMATPLRLFAEFLEGDDAYRTSRFKLIPSIVEGSYGLKYIVGNKPVLLGNKVTQRYWTGPGYIEIGVDCGSSSVASYVLNQVRGASKSVVVEIAVLIEGDKEEELPEQVLGSVRATRLDWTMAESLRDRLECSDTQSPVPGAAVPVAAALAPPTTEL